MWGYFQNYRHLLFDETITAALKAMYSSPPEQGRPPGDVQQ